MRLLPLLLLLPLAACGGGDAAPGQAKSDSKAADPAARGGPITPDEVRAFRLSMERKRKVEQAQAELAARPSDPSIAPADDATLAGTADYVRRQLEADSQSVAALRRAGVTPREAALHTVVFREAMKAAMTDSVPGEVAPENVAWIRENRDAITKDAVDAVLRASQPQRQRP